MDQSSLPSQLPSWQALEQHRNGWSGQSLQALFRDDPGRAGRYSLQVGGMFIDYSKQLTNHETWLLLLQHAEVCGLKRRIEAMFNGEAINNTEGRAVGHWALRDMGDEPLIIQGNDVRPDLEDVLGRMRLLASTVRGGKYLGFSGKPIKNVISIGIGGSDLGPAMSTLALRHFASKKLTVRFVSNVDPADLAENTADLKPEETLFIVASKTFTTLETMANADAARDWIVKSLGSVEAARSHFIALSTNVEAAKQFGVPEAHIFGFWDWVGGRYSLPSAIGLPLMIAIGPKAFDEFRGGYYEMDRHFRTEPLGGNAPVILGLLSLWNTNFLGAATQAIIPYSHDLRRFPAYCQQLIMESNGKQVTRDGKPVNYMTSPIVWGEPGTNAQHSFFQLLHQGPQLIPVDFIGVRGSYAKPEAMNRMLLANMIAQGEALAFGSIGNSDDPVGAHRTFSGNRPSTTILLESLTPASLGQLIALYEHSTFVQGALWGINSFDQFGVELGKKLAGKILEDIHGDQPSHHDSSTEQLMHRSFPRS